MWNKQYICERTFVGTILLFLPISESTLLAEISPKFISASVGHVCSPLRPSAVASRTSESWLKNVRKNVNKSKN